MYTLGHDFVPPSIHAGGLRYHGDAPIISALVRSGRMEAVAYPQSKTFEAAVTWARTQGTVPAPETGHAVRAVIDEALAAKEEGKEKVILFNYSGARVARPFRLGRLPPRPAGRLSAGTTAN
jgi:tryptophan synthase beta chain